MNIIIYNKSKNKRLTSTNRIISQILFKISNILYIGHITKRVLFELVKQLKSKSGRGTCIKIFIESKYGFMGFYLIEIGKKEKIYENFSFSKISFIDELIKENFVNL